MNTKLEIKREPKNGKRKVKREREREIARGWLPLETALTLESLEELPGEGCFKEARRLPRGGSP